jgi:ATP-binding cassette, subfamily B, bacterial PglK
MGKTTLIKILLGLIKSTKGEIKVDGNVITSTDSILPLFSYVGQDPFLINGSIVENVVFGQTPKETDFEHVLHCLELAAFSIDQKHESLLDVQVGENGARLSEGQKQRLVLAREIFKNSPVLILDEPTSALDEITEQKLITGLKELKSAGKTILIIAHRERIYEICDSVFTIENGKLNIP